MSYTNNNFKTNSIVINNNNNNNVKKSKSSCIYCSKQYTNKTSLEKHMLLCCILYKSKRQLKIEEEETEDLPSHNKLCFIVQELTLKIKKLEEKLEIQEKFITKTKKKINVLEWLNNNIIPSDDINTFITNKISVKEDEILFMMNNTFHDTLDKIFAENFDNDSSNSNSNVNPIFCFIQNSNKFYIYSNTNNMTNTNTWSELTKQECIKIFNIIYSKIFKKLMEWKNANEEQLNKSEQLDNLYLKTMGKLMSIDFKNETILSKAKSSLFNKIKTDMKNIIEYEFDF